MFLLPVNSLVKYNPHVNYNILKFYRFEVSPSDMTGAWPMADGKQQKIQAMEPLT